MLWNEKGRTNSDVLKIRDRKTVISSMDVLVKTLEGVFQMEGPPLPAVSLMGIMAFWGGKEANY